MVRQHVRYSLFISIHARGNLPEYSAHAAIFHQVEPFLVSVHEVHLVKKLAPWFVVLLKCPEQALATVAQRELRLDEATSTSSSEDSAPSPDRGQITRKASDSQLTC